MALTLRRLRNRHVLSTFLGMFSLMLIVLFSLASTAMARSFLYINKAEWISERSVLNVEGESGYRRATVEISDPDSGTVLGTTRTDNEGKWKFRASAPAFVPCSIEAEVGSSTAQSSVKYAPNDCGSSSGGDGPPPTPPGGETPPTTDPGGGTPTGGSGSHAGRFSIYEGTKTCLECHTNEALQAHASVHYQWMGDATQAVNIVAEKAGKLGGINDFCIYPDINWISKLTNVNGDLVDGGCAQCHAGLGVKPTASTDVSQLENIDCLVCHSDVYKRTVEQQPDGSYKFVPDETKMTVTITEAAWNVQIPSRDSCLNCHTKAGGGNNFKRGDIEEAHRNPPSRSFDVHMASKALGGAGLNCLDCHTASNHKIAGRGSDLRPRDSWDEVSCTKCHGQTPHDSQDLNKHTKRVNCTVCHIPTFAKVAATDMDRDWSAPGDLVASKGLYEPHHAKGLNQIPEYRFFNGLSTFYTFGDPAVPGGNGRVVMSAPVGDVTDPNAKIYAFKHHLATQPVEKDAKTRRLLPLKIGIFFSTGDTDKAIVTGASTMGWSTNYEFIETERYMGLFHEVAPKSDALSCTDCHSGGKRLDFASLGYTPNSTRNGRPLCASCHSDESGEWKASELFTKVHEKHVKDKKYDCSACHIFSAAK